MSGLLQDKRTFYRRPDVSDSYDEQRFGGASGASVNQREIALVADMLPTGGRVLDLACGTGRLSRALLERSLAVVALDSSAAMAAKAAVTGVPTVLGDAFSLPFAACSFEAVVALRFAFHYDDLAPFLAQMRRVTSPGGSLIFDTYAWSPRAHWAIGAGRWGGRIYLHSRRRVAESAARLGLSVEAAYPCFLFSPYLYRLVPLPLERALEALERRVPQGWLCRIFWKLGVR